MLPRANVLEVGIIADYVQELGHSGVLQTFIVDLGVHVYGVLSSRCKSYAGMLSAHGLFHFCNCSSSVSNTSDSLSCTSRLAQFGYIHRLDIFVLPFLSIA